MKDKKTFGKYIAEKRKKAQLTQEELASRLFVMSSTVSKWERGVTYPDITIITNLCKELNISEHEFFLACDDVASQEKLEALKYRKIKKSISYFFLINYLIALIVCFICNLVIDHKLTWFLIVLVSLSISFSITNLPAYIKKDKFKLIKIVGIVTGLVYLLLFIINLITKGDWFFKATIIASFEFGLLWLGIIICTFSKINKAFKTSLVLLLLSICIYYTNPLCEKVLNITNEANNIYNNLVAISLIFLAFIIFILKCFRIETTKDKIEYKKN